MIKRPGSASRPQPGAEQINVNTPSSLNTYTVYSADHQPLAELNAQGLITRQYLWLAGMLVAVMDSTDQGFRAAAPQPAPPGQALAQDVPLAQDLWALLYTWTQALASPIVGSPWRLTFVHSNHLGAPELATDTNANPVWSAHYAPFGAATVRNFEASASASDSASDTAAASSASAAPFTLNLRLPGQHLDPETGLHYNRQRYYDPQTGQYLTPDPLGQPDGPNAYLYVAGNPLTFIDPDGLVLFAFDGTENSDPVLNPAKDSLSNVVLFRNLYNDGNSRYISGVGTVDISDPARPILAPDGLLGHTLNPDKGFNYSGPARITRMVEYFGAEASLATDDNIAMDVDIIGFSRGAAQARDFSNQIMAASKKDKDGNYWYGYKDKNETPQCQKVNFRFMGLWDTVLSTNSSGHAYKLGIPAQFAYVAQAVALNEYRGNTFATGRPDPSNIDSIGAFPLESIMGDAVPAGQTRIERGFVGSHADIGGGFAESEKSLSKVALAWMLEQAKQAGVKMNPASPTIEASPVIHDKSDNIQTGAPTGPPNFIGEPEDRTVRYLNGSTTEQRRMTDTGLTYTDIVNQDFISYTPRANLPTNFKNEIMSDKTGTVNMKSYIAWLKLNGYDLGSLTVQ